MPTYRTKEGDVLDLIVLEFYGQRAGALEHVLGANHGLSALGPVLPAGIIINLPAMPAEPAVQRPQAQLWGFQP